MTPLFITTGWLVWSGKKKNSSAAWLYNFYGGGVDWHFLVYSNARRVFAIRSR